MSAIKSAIQFEIPAPVVGIYSSFPQQGKTTIANRLVEKFGFRRLSFARVPKRMIVVFLIECGYPEAAAIDFVEVNKDVPLERVSGMPTARYLIKTMASEWGRHLVHPDVWANEWEMKAGVWSRSGKPVVAEDLRFPNEVAAVTRLGGQIWRVEKPDATVGESILSHESEGRLNHLNFDRVFVNDGTKGALHIQVDASVSRSPNAAKLRRSLGVK